MGTAAFDVQKPRFAQCLADVGIVGRHQQFPVYSRVCSKAVSGTLRSGKSLRMAR